MNNKKQTILLRPLSNFDDFNKDNFSASPWKWGFKGYVIGEKDPDCMATIQDMCQTFDDIGVAFVFSEDMDEKYPVVERLEETGMLKFIFFNAVTCKENEADVHALYETKS